MLGPYYDDAPLQLTICDFEQLYNKMIEAVMCVKQSTRSFVTIHNGEITPGSLCSIKIRRTGHPMCAMSVNHTMHAP